MSEDKKNRAKIFKEVAPVTVEELIAYLQGKLSGERLRNVEMLIPENPFVAEALEGYENLPAPEALLPIVAQINNSIESKYQKKAKTVPLFKNFRFLSIAASLLLLFCVTIFFVFKNDDAIETAQENENRQQENSTKDAATQNQQLAAQPIQEPITEASAEVSSESVVKPVQSQTTAAPKAKVYEKNSEANAPATADRQTGAASPKVSLADDVVIPEKEMKKGIAADLVPAQGIAAEQVKSSTYSSQNITENIQRKEIVEDKNTAREIEKIGRLYENKKYKEAITAAEVLLTDNPRLPQADFLAGIAYLMIDQHSQAENKLSLLFGQENNPAFQGFNLKKLIELVRDDNFDQAKELIKDYEWINGKFVKK
jgi:hypothetical protein